MHTEIDIIDNEYIITREEDIKKDEVSKFQKCCPFVITFVSLIIIFGLFG